MEFSDFKFKFIDQFVGEDISTISEDSAFRQLPSWDSLTAMAIIAMIEDEYKVKMTIDEMKELGTIGEVFTFVSSRQLS
ncbi:acyl carrier protein [Chitinophaga barathri]|uniref:Acyl carrier protein n=1 Tax=Chitinophaga barathri TaxID=1647451 RepID=A0A3N4MEV5_9BACT|nr:acyl carrier protein [Chitinophaga barathri]RPD40516.1 acyl carrier protein [Chitinophaga barathri]